MNIIFTCQSMMLTRLKKEEDGSMNRVCIHFPDKPSDELLQKLLVYAANLALEEGMDIIEECKSIKITE